MTFAGAAAYVPAMIRACILAVLVACGSVQAQLAPPSAPVQRLAAVQADGTVEVLDGFVDLRAIKTIGGLDQETTERVNRFAREWLLDVQQQVIDNVDFVIQIEPLDGSTGYLDTINPQDPKSFERASKYALQLNSSGTLLNALLGRRVLSSEQAQSFQREVYNYDMALLRQVVGSGHDMTLSTRHQYRMSFRDALGMYHSLLDRAVSCIDRAVEALGPEAAAKVKPEVASVKAAKGRDEGRAAMRGLLQKLTHAQRRALLMKVRDLVPITNALSFV